ncbi:MAG TPA: RsmE family RNA methyltransferase [Dehalococcoidia bacterium]|nr:RsmE family RNA methyltransferase [Dehalococcoidia bacterium]
MHRFHLPKLHEQQTFAAEQVRQIGRVLRLQPGDRVEVFDGRGRTAELRLESVTREAVTGALVPGSEREVPWPSPVRPLLYLALIRPQRFEWAIEKATELAAWRIVPLLTQRTAHAGAELGAARLQRWQQIAVEAAEQCGSAYLPEVARPLPLAAALCEPAALRLFAWEGGGARLSMRRALHGAPRDAPASGDLGGVPAVAVFVGPEGGFSEAEVAMARQAGCRLLTLGPLTLRAETAAVAALVALSEALRDSPKPE